MTSYFKRSLVLGVILMIGAAFMGVKAYQDDTHRREVLAFTSNVTEAKQWTLINQVKVPHATFYAGFLDETFGMTVGYHGATYTTTDSGKTWCEGVNKANCRFGLDMLSGKYLWTVGNYGGNRVSKNGGRNLFEVSDLPLIDELPNNLVDILDEQNVFVASPLRLGYTSDGGTSWQDISRPTKCEQIAGMDFISVNKGFVMDFQGNVYYTEDKGAHWVGMAKMPVASTIHFDEPPSVTMVVNQNNVMTVVYSDQDEGIYSYQVNFDDAVKGNGKGNEPLIWHKIQLEDRPRAIGYLSKDGLYLTTVDIVGNIHLFKLERK